MDSFDSDCGCAATWSKRNKYWICDIQLLVSPFYRGKHGNLNDYRLDGAGACCNMPYFRRDWTGTVDQKKKHFQGGCRYHDFGCVFCHRVLGICDF